MKTHSLFARRAWVAWLAALAGACAVTLSFLLQHSDVCLRTGETLSDEQRIKAAVGAVLSDYPPPVVKKTWVERDGKRLLEEPASDNPLRAYSLHKPIRPIAYRDSDEFLARNKDYCSVVPMRSLEEGTPSRLKGLFGADASYMRLAYLVRYTDDQGRVIDVLYEELVGITSCGKVSRSAGKIISKGET